MQYFESKNGNHIEGLCYHRNLNSDRQDYLTHSMAHGCGRYRYSVRFANLCQHCTCHRLPTGLATAWEPCNPSHVCLKPHLHPHAVSPMHALMVPCAVLLSHCLTYVLSHPCMALALSLTGPLPLPGPGPRCLPCTPSHTCTVSHACCLAHMPSHTCTISHAWPLSCMSPPSSSPSPLPSPTCCLVHESLLLCHFLHMYPPPHMVLHICYCPHAASCM